MTQMPTVNDKTFIKVIDQKLADKLIASGFSYIQEGSFYVFANSPEITSVLQRMEFSSDKKYFTENKLRF